MLLVSIEQMGDSCVSKKEKKMGDTKWEVNQNWIRIKEGYNASQRDGYRKKKTLRRLDDSYQTSLKKVIDATVMK